MLVLHRHLALAVRAQILHRAAVVPGGAARLGEAACQLVRQADRRRHQLRRLVAGEADHHALVAGADRVQLGVGERAGGEAVAVLDRGAHAHVDVRALLADRGDDAAGAVVEAVARIGVASLADRLAHDLGNIDPGGGGDLAGDEDQAGGRRRLAGHARQRVVTQHRVEHAVADLVAQLVGMPLGHALAGEIGCRIAVETAAAHATRRPLLPLTHHSTYHVPAGFRYSSAAPARRLSDQRDSLSESLAEDAQSRLRSND